MGHFGGNAHDVADLADRARLKRDVVQAGLDEFVDECDRVLELGDASRNDDAVDRRPRARAFCTSRLPPSWSFHRYGSR